MMGYGLVLGSEASWSDNLYTFLPEWIVFTGHSSVVPAAT